MKRPRWRTLSMQPKSKAHEAYEFLQNYNGLTNANELISYRCERWLADGESLMRNGDPADGYILQGFAYTLLGNNELAIESMRMAKDLNNYFGKMNYAWLLIRSGEFDQGLCNSLELLRHNSTDQKLLFIVLEGIKYTLNIDLLKPLFELYKGDDKDSFSIYNRLNENIKLLQDLNIDKNNFINVTKILTNFLAYRYFGDYSIGMHVAESEIGKKLDLNIYLYNVDIENCLELNDLFLDALINDDGTQFDDYKDILVHFMPMEYK